MKYDFKPIPLSEKDRHDLLRCSVERILNTAINMAEAVAAGKTIRFAVEDAETSLQDLEEFKSLIVKLWQNAAEEQRVNLLNGETQ